ncbi:MAG: FlgO family outer membrane protein [Myxococcales bacterium]|jgi:TolB-like protein
MTATQRLFVLFLVLTAFIGQAFADPAWEAPAAAAGQELAKGVEAARRKRRIVSVAVPAFKEAGPGAAGLGAPVSQRWAEALAAVAKVKLVDSARLKRIVGGRRLQELSEGERSELKKLVAAQATIVGLVQASGDELVVNASLILNATGEVLASSRQVVTRAAPQAAPAAAPTAPSAEAQQAEQAQTPSAAATAAAPEAAPAPAAAPEVAAAPTAAPAAKAVPAPERGPEQKSPSSDLGAVESTSVEIQMRKLADSLAAAFEKLPGKARYRRLAVVPFTDLGEQAKRHEIGAIVTAEIATCLRRDHNLLLVERAQLATVFEELKLMSLSVDDLSAVPDLGKMTDAQALVIGSVAEAGDKYLVNARLVATSNAETLAAESVSVAAAGMVALASNAVVLRSRSGAVFRSLLIPGWGQFYNRQAWKGWGFIGLEAAALGGALAFQLAGDRAYNDYKSRTSADQLGDDPPARAAELYETASSRYETRNVLLFVAAGIWALNVIDAFASGVDGESLLAGGVASGPSGFRPLATVGPDGGSLGFVTSW